MFESLHCHITYGCTVVTQIPDSGYQVKLDIRTSESPDIKCLDIKACPDIGCPDIKARLDIEAVQISGVLI